MNEVLKRCGVVDTETTGIDTKTCKVVEAALHLVGTDEGFDWLVNPGEPIPPEASAIHHICDADVAMAANWDTVKLFIEANIKNNLCHNDQLPILVAHNADYDKPVLGLTIPVLWVCTYKCALRVWPDAPSHKNEVLRYHLKLGSLGRNGSNASHSALHDAEVTGRIFKELLKHASIDELIEWTEQPAKLPRMPMGKHYGQTWDTIPSPYLNWILGVADMREDVKHCAREELERRRRK